MFEIIGFLLLCMLNAFFTGYLAVILLLGGFEMTFLFSKQTETADKVSWFVAAVINVLIWHWIIDHSPLSVVVK